VPARVWIGHAVAMISDAVTAVRAAVDAINDRSLGGRAAEILDPSFIRHDLASCSAITASGCPGTPAAGLRIGLGELRGAVAVGGRGCHGGQRGKSWQRWSQVVPGVA